MVSSNDSRSFETNYWLLTRSIDVVGLCLNHPLLAREVGGFDRGQDLDGVLGKRLVLDVVHGVGNCFQQ